MTTFVASIRVGEGIDTLGTDHMLPGTFTRTWDAWQALADTVDPFGDACAQRMRDILTTYAEEGMPNIVLDFPESGIRFAVAQFIEIGA